MAQILQQLRDQRRIIDDQRRDIDAAIRALEALDRSQPKAQQSRLTVVPLITTEATAA